MSDLEKMYPYDPDADATRLNGLDKLRAVRDRTQAAMLYSLYLTCLPRWLDEERRWVNVEEQRQRRRDREERDDLAAVARRSLAGGHEKTTPGAEALARHILGQAGADADISTLRRFQRELLALWKEAQGFTGDWKNG